MLHITSTETGEACWSVVDQRIRMESATNYRSHVPAYRMRLDGSKVEIPNGTMGTVYFGEADERPDLALVREWLPEHFGLWAAVSAAFWDAVVPLDHSRLDDLSDLAYDYSTGKWDAAEVRTAASQSLEAQP